MLKIRVATPDSGVGVGSRPSFQTWWDPDPAFKHGRIRISIPSLWIAAIDNGHFQTKLEKIVAYGDNGK